MKPIEYHPAAAIELEESMVWYANKDESLGRRLNRDIREIEALIQHYPKRYEYDGATKCRQAVIRGFPYSIWYFDGTEVVWIIAVAHHRRRPGYWRDRLSDVLGDE
jgi:toxin ParE1/3/4